MPRDSLLHSLRLAALMLVLTSFSAFAADAPQASKGVCRMPLVTGQWQHLEDNSRWAFFSSGRVDCRACREWNDRGSCVYVYDPADEQRRQQCRWQSGKALSMQVPDGTVTVTGWRATEGRLTALEFSDGTVADVSDCEIDGSKGEMHIPAVGTFACHYNYQCNKLERELPGKDKDTKSANDTGE